MKKLEKLKLNKLSKADLKKQEMSILLGGGTPGCCNCGCNGPSSISENWSANNLSGYGSGGSGEICSCDGGNCPSADVEIQPE